MLEDCTKAEIEDARKMYGPYAFIIKCNGSASDKFIVGSCQVPVKLWGSSNESIENAFAWAQRKLDDNPEYGICDDCGCLASVTTIWNGGECHTACEKCLS